MIDPPAPDFTSETGRAMRRPSEIGAELRRLRRQMGLSQSEVANRAGLRQATVSALEAGEGGASLNTLSLALAALNVELLLRPRVEEGANPDGPETYEGLW